MGSVDRGIAEFEETNFKQVARPSAMASSDKIWHYEQVKIKDSEYAKKCGIGGDCYFYVSKGQIKISQLDNKTSLDLAISRIRTWGASSTTFFLELGSRSPAGEGRLEMTHKNPNDLRLMVRETTSTRRQPGAGSGAGASKAPRRSENAVEEQYYDSEIPGPGPRGGGAYESDYNDGPGGAGDRSNYITEEAPEEAYEDQYEYEGQNYGEVKVKLPSKTYYGGKYE